MAVMRTAKGVVAPPPPPPPPPPFASAGVEKASATVKDSGHVHGARKGTTFSII